MPSKLKSDIQVYSGAPKVLYKKLMMFFGLGGRREYKNFFFSGLGGGRGIQKLDFFFSGLGGPGNIWP